MRQREIRVTVWLHGEKLGTLPKSEVAELVRRGSPIVGTDVTGLVVVGGDS